MNNISPKFSQITYGIFWKISSCACFAAINGVIKLLTQDLPVNNILFWQNFIAVLFLLPLFITQAKPILNPTQTINLRSYSIWLWHCIRIACAIAGTSLWFIALKYLPIAQVVALSFVGPIIGIAGAILILKEKLNALRAAAITISFIGSICILRPDYPALIEHSRSFAALLPMAAAICFTFSKLATRKLAHSGISASYLALLLVVCIVPVAFVLALPTWQWPTMQQAYYLILVGGLAAGAHYSFSKAYAYAEVTVLMPVGFVKFLLSVAAGYILFNELPNHILHWTGIACIFISTIFIHFDGYKVNNT